VITPVILTITVNNDFDVYYMFMTYVEQKETNRKRKYNLVDEPTPLRGGEAYGVLFQR